MELCEPVPQFPGLHAVLLGSAPVARHQDRLAPPGSSGLYTSHFTTESSHIPYLRERIKGEVSRDRYFFTYTLKLNLYCLCLR